MCIFGTELCELTLYPSCQGINGYDRYSHVIKPNLIFDNLLEGSITKRFETIVMFGC